MPRINILNISIVDSTTPVKFRDLKGIKHRDKFSLQKLKKKGRQSMSLLELVIFTRSF